MIQLSDIFVMWYVRDNRIYTIWGYRVKKKLKCVFCVFKFLSAVQEKNEIEEMCLCLLFTTLRNVQYHTSLLY